MYQNKRKSGVKKDHQVDMMSINSAALQDHFLKSANINLNLQKQFMTNPINMPRKPPRQQKTLNKLDTRNKESLQQSAKNVLLNAMTGNQQSQNYNNNTLQQYNNNINDQNEFLSQQQQMYQDLQNQNNQMYNNEFQSQDQQSSVRSNSQQQKKRNTLKSIRIGHNKIQLQKSKSALKPNSQNSSSLQGQNKITQFQNGNNQQQLDFELYDKQKLEFEKERETVKMKQYYSNLTLAQRLGIVDAPQKPLTYKDWEQIEEQSKKRNDSDGCCAICLDDFKDQEQVLLSCSHVFHQNCLSSFEKHNKQLGKACPICRRKHYDKKTFDQGFKQYVIKCTIKIQKCWRGGQQRIQFYRKLIDDKYKAESMLLRRRILGYKLMKFGTHMTSALEERKQQNMEYLKKQEKDIQFNQEKLEKNLDELKELKKANNKFMTEFLRNQNDQIQQDFRDGNYDNDQNNNNYQQNSNSNNNNQLRNEQCIKKVLEKKVKKTQNQWEEIKKVAIERNEPDCAICFNSLVCKDQEKKKSLFLLSCTHIFHSNCLNAFERYNLSKDHECPICRTEYEKVHLAAISQVIEKTKQQQIKIQQQQQGNKQTYNQQNNSNNMFHSNNNFKYGEQQQQQNQNNRRFK